MFDVWYGDIEVTTLILILSAAFLLPVQLILCFKAKDLKIRLIPVCTFAFAALAMICMALISDGWDPLGYIFLAVFAGIMLFSCGIGWLIWAIIARRIKTCYLVLAIICTLLTFVSAGHVLNSHGRLNAGYAVIPMVSAAAFLSLYRGYKE